MLRRQFILTALPGTIGLLTSPPWALAETQAAPPQLLLNQTGRLRMLPQRCLKLYLQIGQHVAAEQSAKLLEQSIKYCQLQLSQLQSMPALKQEKPRLNELSQHWQSFSQNLQIPAETSHARQLYPEADKLSNEAEQLMQNLLKIFPGLAKELTNLAGRQRMLTQRMAKIYQALVWHVVPATEITELALSRNEFVNALKRLQLAVASFPGSQAALERTAQQWLFFDLAIQQIALGDKIQQAQHHVASTSERLLESLDELTLSYQNA